MKDKYYLALADEVELDKKDKVKKAVIGLIILEVILQICYQLYPFLLMLANKNQLISIAILAIFIIVFAIVAEHFSLTTKVFNERLKPLARWLTTITIIILTLIILGDGVQISSVFKLSVNKIIKIISVALPAGVCEELLFRGILFNIFLLVFRKNKYNIIYTVVISSVLFGLYHLMNLAHQPLISTIGQVMGATLLGLILSYLHLWTNSLVWCIILHFLQDLAPQLAKSDWGNPHITNVMIMSIPLIIIMLICIYAFNRRYLEMKE